MAYGRQWGHSYSTQDWNRLYHYPYVYYPQNFWGTDYYRSSEDLYFRYPPEMRIPVYHKQWENYYPQHRQDPPWKEYQFFPMFIGEIGTRGSGTTRGTTSTRTCSTAAECALSGGIPGKPRLCAVRGVAALRIVFHNWRREGFALHKHCPSQVPAPPVKGFFCPLIARDAGHLLVLALRTNGLLTLFVQAHLCPFSRVILHAETTRRLVGREDGRDDLRADATCSWPAPKVQPCTMALPASSWIAGEPLPRVVPVARSGRRWR